MMEMLFLLGRVLYGGFFVMTGMNHFTKLADMTGYAASKNVPSSKIAVLFSGMMIVLGGLGILLGTSVELAILLLLAFLVPVSVKMHDFWNVKDGQAKMMEMVMFMKNAALVGAGLMMLMIPQPWAMSLGL